MILLKNAQLTAADHALIFVRELAQAPYLVLSPPQLRRLCGREKLKERFTDLLFDALWELSFILDEINYSEQNDAGDTVHIRLYIIYSRKFAIGMITNSPIGTYPRPASNAAINNLIMRNK